MNSKRVSFTNSNGRTKLTNSNKKINSLKKISLLLSLSANLHHISSIRRMAIGNKFSLRKSLIVSTQIIFSFSFSPQKSNIKEQSLQCSEGKGRVRQEVASHFRLFIFLLNFDTTYFSNLKKSVP